MKLNYNKNYVSISSNSITLDYKYNDLIIIIKGNKKKLIESGSGTYIKFLSQKEYEMLTFVYDVRVINYNSNNSF